MVRLVGEGLEAWLGVSGSGPSDITAEPEDRRCRDGVLLAAAEVYCTCLSGESKYSDQSLDLFYSLRPSATPALSFAA